MFKPKARPFPPGTFVPTPLRVVSIIHLCIAFSALLFDLGYPFMGKLFEDKRLNSIYESVIAESALYQQLSFEKQTEIQAAHQALLNRMHQPFSTKFDHAMRILLIELPPFQKAWIFFSIIIPILILMKIDGAHRAAWILPIITLVFIANQFTFPTVPEKWKENALFPTEQMLLDQYLGEPLANSISDQREQLLKGWHLYLIKEWSKEEPSQTESDFKRQLSKGLFAFNLARIDAIQQDSLFPSYLRNKEPFLLVMFLLWNLFFAWFANRRKWFIL
ncbi:hypothetical protein [Waddlia chondrophila]|uniref:Uncharacterized protein n=2 Tax=Waddlia chondrophila TaxID=71667 RepID=D6YSL9_WADCW|nr:hypothetical protein [Waddlia chondrophila]ADI39064.1 hypothetical protein wcw_1723 [Waddlia chondrophila WSU 86-1044]